jgi:hypothetical protein
VGLAERDGVVGALRRADRLARIPVGADVVTQVAPHVAEPEMPGRREGRVGEARSLLAAPQQEIERLGKLAEKVERMGEPEGERRQLALALLDGQALGCRSASRSTAAGLGVRVRPRRALRHAHEMRDGLRRPIGAREVVREPVRDLLEPALRRGRSSASPAARGDPAGGLGRKAFVRHVPRERVLEEVHGLLEAPVPWRNSSRVSSRSWGSSGPGPVQIARRRSSGTSRPEHRGRLEGPLPFRRQTADPRQRTSWTSPARPAARRPAVRSATARTSSSRKNGLPSAAARIVSASGVGDRRDRHHGADEGEAVPRSERLKRDLRCVGLVAPRRPVPGSVGEEQQHRRAGHDIDQRRQELLRRAIDPVEVLDYKRQGLAPAGAQGELPERLEGAGLERLRAQRLERLGVGLHSEEVEQTGGAVLAREARLG